jgi:uncharacterized protein (TIGR02147 family)
LPDQFENTLFSIFFQIYCLNANGTGKFLLMKTDYIDFLSEEIARRKGRNERYSERAFAKAIGISPGFLKHLLQRKKNLGHGKALDVARRLSWTDFKTDRFMALLEQRKSEIRGATTRTTLRDSEFEEVSDWYAFPIIELLEIVAIESGADCAERLGISKLEADHILRKLERASLIHKEGKFYRKTAPNYEIPSMSMSAIKKFHRQTLVRAAEAVDSQVFGKRELRALTLAFDTARMAEVQTELTKFLRSFERKFCKGAKNSVFQMNLAFYRVDKI